jgi:tetratricopeptide (TPR) repeat protein
LSDPDKAEVLNEAGFYLRSQGRLSESVEALSAAVALNVRIPDLRAAAITSNNLGEALLLLGRLYSGLQASTNSVTHARDTQEPALESGFLSAVANCYHQLGDEAQAKTDFAQAERLFLSLKPELPGLIALAGSRYCSFLLSSVERAVWRVLMDWQDTSNSEAFDFASVLADVLDRARHSLAVVSARGWRLAMGHDLLIIGQAEFYKSVLNGSPTALREAATGLGAAVSQLRRAGQSQELPPALLVSAAAAARDGQAQESIAQLNEAWEIARRGPMPLYLADIYLTRARLFAKAPSYPWRAGVSEIRGGFVHDLRQAETLIVEMGYDRRRAELSDALAASATWQ